MTPHPHSGPSRLAAMFDDAVVANDEAICLVTDDRAWTYRQVHDGVESMAGWLADHGAVEGDVVIGLAGTDELAFLTLWACLISGLAFAPLDPEEDPETIDKVCRRTRARVIIGPAATLADVTWPATRLAWDGDDRHDALTHRHRPDARTSRDDAVALITHTSGTTGEAKGVVLTAANLAASVESCAQWMSPAWESLGISEHVLLAAMPYHHIFGVLTGILLPVRLRGAVHRLDFSDPSVLAQTIDRTQPSLLALIPSVYQAVAAQLVAHGWTRDVPTALCVTGAVPLPAHVASAWRDAFACELHSWYGMSESASMGTFQPVDRPPTLGDVGLPQPGCMVIVRGPDGTDLACGETGQVLLRGEHIFDRYWEQPELTANTKVDGWLHTGDMGHLNPDGSLTLVGRMNDLLNVDGRTVIPQQVERVLEEVSGVVRAGVYGRPAGAAGEVVMAAVTLEEDATCDTEAILQHARTHLPDYMVPLRLNILTELPTGRSGKLLRKNLRSAVRRK